MTEATTQTVEVAPEPASESPPQAFKKKKLTRPPKWTKMYLLDNKHNPDYYVAGLVIGFLGLEFLEQYYPTLMREEGKDSYEYGKRDVRESMAVMLAGGEYERGTPVFDDFVADLWRVRNTDPNTFDAAVCEKYGKYRGLVLVGEIIKQGAVRRDPGDSEIVERIYHLMKKGYTSA